MRHLVNSIDRMAFRGQRVQHFIHICRVHVRIDNHNIIGEEPGLRRPHGMRDATRKINKGYLGGNDRHMAHAIRWTKDPFHRQTQFF